MSLTARLAILSLAVLAVVLAGFSLALHAMMSQHLYADADHQLTAALDVLESAVEVDDDVVEWDPPDDHPLATGEVRWAVVAPNGVVVARSAIAGLPATATDVGKPHNHDGWRTASRRFAPVGTASQKTQRGHYPALIVAVGVPLAPMEETLNGLAANLAILSGVVWCAVAALAGWLYLRALAPLRRLAEAADGVTAGTMSARLPDPGTNDELSRLCAAFNGVLDRLEEAFERQRRFTAEASHQLRTPLAALLGQVEVACRRQRTGEEYVRVLGAVAAEGERLRQVVEALLFLARSDADAAPPAVQQIELSHWLPAQLKRWASHPRSADLHLEPIPPGIVAMETHPTLLAQALDALVENALKYGTAGTPVTVSVSTGDDSILLRVEDQGWGIAEEELPRLFEPFFRSDAARRSGRPGSGLGLSVVSRIARVLGGTVEVASELGHGTCFTLRLPGVGCAADQSRARSEAAGRAK